MAKKKSSTSTLRMASVLAFRSKLVPSDAIMRSGIWDERGQPDAFQPIKVEVKALRGTISNRLKSPLQNDPAKIDAEIQKANLQTVDNAALPFKHDALQVSFTLRIMGDLAVPSACNSSDYQAALKTVIDDYTAETQFTELSKRYATNLANGRFLWNNRASGELIEIQIKHEDEVWTFDALDFSLNKFSDPTGDLSKLADVFQKGLKGESFALLRVEAFVKIGEGQPVYPSQELVMNIPGGNKKKFLYQLDGCAAMHSQKIGNALRTIDTWHSDVDESGPIAVEVYGSVTNRGKAYRQPKDGLDFYTLLDKWLLEGQKPELPQQHYVMATLIRGGVFGGSSKDASGDPEQE